MQIKSAVGRQQAVKSAQGDGGPAQVFQDVAADDGVKLFADRSQQRFVFGVIVGLAIRQTPRAHIDEVIER
jgi:hypothetical protein